MMVFKAGIHKIFFRVANREDPDQDASWEAAWSGSALFVLFFFRQAKSVPNFRKFIIGTLLYIICLA